MVVVLDADAVRGDIFVSTKYLLRSQFTKQLLFIISVDTLET